jgi:predicted DsbA family dithiol-disulfide isomerase
MTPRLHLSVYFDFICPWCMIGKRHLQTALTQFASTRPDVEVRIDWLSQQLLPSVPPEGVDYETFYINRLGSPAAVAARREQVRMAARAANLELAFEKIARMPNTLRAHHLVELARPAVSAAQLATLLDAVFAAYFQHGQDIGETSVLLDLASAAGCDTTALATALLDPERQRQFAGRLAAPPRHAVSGVPFFVFNDCLGASGAIPPADLVAAMTKAIAIANQ